MEQELFNKKIRRHIKLKYAGVIILLTELLVTFILVGVQTIVYAIGTEQAVKASGSLFALAFGLIAIALIIIIIYDRTAPWRKLSDSDIARNFIGFFGTENLNVLIYTEVIVWFAREIQRIYRKKSYEYEKDAIADCLVQLKLLFRYKHNSTGFFLAFYHKEEFENLCRMLVAHMDSDDFPSYSKAEIYACKARMDDEASDKISLFISEGLKANLRSIALYIIVLTFHVLACCNVLFGKEGFDLQNFFFYIPADILAILIYTKLVSDKWV